MFLTLMLGTRRAAVSVVATRLQRDGIIRYRRGKLSIVDRPVIESLACECYRALAASFERLHA